MFKNVLRRASALVLMGAFSLGGAWAQAPAVKVEGAWARATVAGQSAGGAFMALTAARDVQVLGGSSPAAASVEVHEMTMRDHVMRMQAIDALKLPAGQTVELKPGGYHLMLIGLKAPLAAGTQVPITLRLRDAQGAEFGQDVQLEVRSINAPAGGHGHGHGGAHGG